MSGEFFSLQNGVVTMKKILFPLMMAFALIVGITGLSMLSSDNAEASIYPYGYTGQWTSIGYSTGTAPSGWNWIRQTVTFPGSTNATSTDTLFMIFNPSAPNSSIQDTLIATIHLIAKPATSYGAADTLNVKYELWTSDDTTGWRKGSVTFNNEVWQKYTAEGQDSSITGYSSRMNYVGFTRHLGRHPYTAIVAIGKTPSGGRRNYAGTTVEANVIEQ